MQNTFFYLQRTGYSFSINLTNFLGETILIGRETEIKHDYRKYLQSLKTHLFFSSNYYRVKSSKGTYAFEIRTCWDELLAQSIFFETREQREMAMKDIFEANKVAELREVALYAYVNTRISIAS